MSSRPKSLATESRRALNLDPRVEAALRDVEDELRSQYAEALVDLSRTVNEQASALNRIQRTLEILVEALRPNLAKDLRDIPPAISVAGDGERPDIASAIVVADPVGAGYVLTQQTLADALGVNQPDVSVLVKAFGLVEDGECAVVVRKGKQRDIVNYHPRAVQRFRERVANPPSGLNKVQLAALERVRRKLVLGSSG